MAHFVFDFRAVFLSESQKKNPDNFSFAVSNESSKNFSSFNSRNATLHNSPVFDINLMRSNSDATKLVLANASAILNPAVVLSENYSSGLNSKNSYFTMPTTGWNWGKLHEKNGVDIANSCGTPVYAAAEGLVTDNANNNEWNNGYGNYIKIEHPNNAETYYLHLNKVIVDIGKYVSQGDLIAEMGNTGNTEGPTGCHLHFEVRGTENPLAK